MRFLVYAHAYFSCTHDTPPRVQHFSAFHYCSELSQYLSMLTSEITKCSSTECSCHNEALNDYAQHLVSTLFECAYQWFPTYTITSSLFDGADKLKEATNF